MQTERPWFRHYPPGVKHTLEYPKVPLTHLVKASAERHPDRAATIFFGAKVTYGQLWGQIEDFAAALAAAGLKPGERVAIMLPNCPQLLIAFFGVLRAGGIVVMTNPLYVERELEHQLNDSGASFLVALDHLWPRIDRVRAKTAVRKIILTGMKDYLPFPLSLLYPLKAKRDGLNTQIPQDPQVVPFRAFLSGGQGAPRVALEQPYNEVALLQYTGGTTGLAKGAMLSHYNLVVNAVQCVNWLGSDIDGEVVLAAIPIFHVYGLTAAMNFALVTASTLILVPKFQPQEILKLIEKHRPTFFPGAPPMYVAINAAASERSYDLSSIKACISGAAALPVEVQAQFEALTGGKLVEGYGLTEASPVTHCTPMSGPRIPGSIGLPWPDTDVRICDPNDPTVELPPGELGELCIRGPQVMLGYWNRPEETRAQLSEDGWLRTGDMARMDEEGWTYIADRIKDVIIAGGFNIYPREVEEVLFKHPAIQEAVVVGVPHEYRGQDVKAFIVLRPGHQLTAEELNQFCREHLASYKVPRQVEFRTELPKSLAGKVLRRVLLEEELKRGSA